MHSNTVRKDTGSWMFQVWVAFSSSLFSMLYGTYNLPVDLWVKGFVIMGFFFMIGSSFALSKTIRDNRDHVIDSRAWILQIWISFGISCGMLGLGLLNLPVDFWVRGYMLIGMVFTLNATFSLAKTMRDLHEANRMIEHQSAEVRVPPPLPTPLQNDASHSLPSWSNAHTL